MLIEDTEPLSDVFTRRRSLERRAVDNLPRFGSADEVDDAHIGPVLIVGGSVRVDGRGSHIVNEWQALADIFGGPIGEVRVQKSLITSCKIQLIDF